MLCSHWPAATWSYRTENRARMSCGRNTLHHNNLKAFHDSVRSPAVSCHCHHACFCCEGVYTVGNNVLVICVRVFTAHPEFPSKTSPCVSYYLCQLTIFSPVSLASLFLEQDTSIHTFAYWQSLAQVHISDGWSCHRWTEVSIGNIAQIG